MKKLFLYISLIAVSFSSSCGGEDYMPIYFKPAPDKPPSQEPSSSTMQGDCTLSFSSELCVVLKGDNIDVGTNEEDKLCVDVPAFPLHISNGKEVTLRGDEFPEIPVEGHGLPAPIKINARGDGDGKKNVGKGEITPDGNIVINGFSFYIDALGVVGQVPNLTFTTGETEELPFLGVMNGNKPDASGAMTLIAGTTLGSIIEAADKYLLGASLTATFTGAISPTLSQCSGDSGTKDISMMEYSVDANGVIKEIPVPINNEITISSGTYISQGASDVGSNFESTKKYRAKNVSDKPLKINIPAKKGAFYIEAQPSNGELKQQGIVSLSITFRPGTKDTKPGKIEENLIIGTQAFQLTGVALDKSGEVTIDEVSENGDTTGKMIDEVELLNIAVPANTKRKFFKCEKITCNKKDEWTDCLNCESPEKDKCILLPVSSDGKALGERNKKCEFTNPDATPLFVIDLKGDTKTEIVVSKQVIALRNRGTEELEINELQLEEIENSKSNGEFSISKDEIFISNRFDSKNRTKVTLPFKLSPYLTGVREESAFISISYQPKDLIGSDGTMAGVGSSAVDRAKLKIITAKNETITTDLIGRTSIKEVPPLELYFKTSTGTKEIKHNGQFPFKGVTAETTDSAFPLFLKPAQGSNKTLRITGIKITGEDSDFYQWLNSADKIRSLKPDTGKGIPCTIPTFDAEGELLNDIADPKPVQIEPPGIDLLPGSYTLESMPFMGCVNFHRDVSNSGSTNKNMFIANLVVSAQEISPDGTPVQNSDGSFKEIEYTIELASAISPRKGHLVLRITQTMAIILNQTTPFLSSIASYDESKPLLDSGKLKMGDLQVFTAAMILDPFDEMTIKTFGDNKIPTGFDDTMTDILTVPNDGITGVFRAISTHPSKENYDDPLLYDFAGLSYNYLNPDGEKGIYEDYPEKNFPEKLQSNGWRIFTGSLSYPGPLAPSEQRPFTPSYCEVIDPCDRESHKKFTSAGVKPGEKGACSFFYASAGKWGSPSLHTKDQMEGGKFEHLCKHVGEKQELYDANTGTYTIDGNVTFEEIGLRLFGPTFIHNYFGPIAGGVPPLDAVLHTTFTTKTIKPQENPDEPDIIPDKSINASKRNYLINLTDKSFSNISPPICAKNTNNSVIAGKKSSTWKYLRDVLSQDPDGKIPAGCPEKDNDFKGGLAYLHGKPINHETGAITFVTAANFGLDKNLTFAFQNTIVFLVLKGWLCDPENGREEDYEGKLCYSQGFTMGDRTGQISIIEP
ncbi:MAG: hypothetical protein ABIE74_07010 [Pseudomonadota bacterium]